MVSHLHYFYSVMQDHKSESNVQMRIRETLLINSHFVATDLQFYELVHSKFQNVLFTILGIMGMFVLLFGF